MGFLKVRMNQIAISDTGICRQKSNSVITVAKDGSGQYTSIQTAIDQSSLENAPVTIFIKQGVYEEKLHIKNSHLTLVGEGRDSTVITASTANGMLDAEGRIWATEGSRTVCVEADHILISNLTIKNDFDFPANQRKLDSDPSKIYNTQAVALLLADSSDKVQIEAVNLVSFHDTLYIRGKRSYFQNVLIKGTVDFIFGSGTAYFRHCELVSRVRKDTLRGESFGYICAPSTDKSHSYGFVFDHCRLLKEDNNVPQGSCALGRPWHPTTQFEDGFYADPNAIGQAIFMHCFLDDHIYGWDKMSGKGKNNETIWFLAQDARFYECDNVGLGAASTSYSRPQLNKNVVDDYSLTQVLAHWEPENL